MRLARHPSALEIEIADDGPGAPAGPHAATGWPGCGSGPKQMVNGAFEAGPRPGGGYRVLGPTLPFGGSR